MNTRANASAGKSPYVFLFSDDIDVPSSGHEARSIALLTVASLMTLLETTLT